MPLPKTDETPDKGSVLEHPAVKQPPIFHPIGFIQPKGSFHFSVDALLLGAFLNPQPAEHNLLDLGTGCGVVAIRQLFLDSRLRAVGIDFQQPLLDAAQANAVHFGVHERLRLFCTDLAQCSADTLGLLGLKQFALVCANPPYRIVGTGRLPQNALRAKALFGQAEIVEIFCRAAAIFLKPKGRFAIISPANQLERLLQALQAAALYPRKILFIHPVRGLPAKLVLLEAVKHPLFCLNNLQSLFLYEEKNNGRALSKEALQFCPDLGVNPIRPAK